MTAPRMVLTLARNTGLVPNPCPLDGEPLAVVWGTEPSSPGKLGDQGRSESGGTGIPFNGGHPMLGLLNLR